MRKIAVLTSGGDAPGMNAAIRAVVRAGLTNDCEVFGIENGFKGLVENKIKKMHHKDVSDIMVRGGTILGSARLPEFAQDEVLQKGVDNLRNLGIEALVTIGGDGTFRGAQALSEKGLSCIGVPSTIDNDIACSEFCIGFDTALNTIIEAIDKLRDTSASLERCSIVEVMGNRCGDLALYAGISSGAEIVITPETGFDEDAVIERLNFLEINRAKRHAIVVVSEKMINVESFSERVSAETPFSGRATILGHVQRGGAPTAFDRVLATRMGDYAVNLILQGNTCTCIGFTGNKLVATSIAEALAMPDYSRAELYEMHRRLV